MSSKLNDERIKLSLKSSNYAIATSIASTENDVAIYMLANNSNLYNWNSSNSGAFYGAELINIGTDNEHHEPYIAIDHYGTQKLAQFNNNQIKLNRDVIPAGNETYSLGTENNRWKDLWLSGSTIALGDISMSTGESGLELATVTPSDPNLPPVPPPGLQLGSVILKSASGGTAVMTLTDEGKVSTKTTTASGEPAPADTDIDGDLLVTKTVTTSNLISTSNAQVHNLEIFNTSNNSSSLLIQNGTNLHNMIETSNSQQNFFIIDKDANLGINKVPTVAFDIVGNANIDGNLSVTGKQIALGDYNIDGTLIVNTDVFINRNQIVEGSVIIRGDQLVQGNQIINGDLEVDSNQVIKKHLTVYSNLNVNNDLTVDYNQIIKRDLTVYSNLQVNNDLVVDNNQLVKRDLTVNSNLYVNNNLVVDYNQIVKRDLTVYSNLVVNGYEVVDGDLLVKKDVIIDKNLYLEGTLRASNLEIVGDRTIVDTQTYQTENLHIMNDSADGASIKVQHRDANNHIFEASNLSDVFVIIDKDANLGINKVPTAALDVNGHANIDGTLIVNTDVFINRNQTIEGSAITRGNQLVQGNQIINGDLEVDSNQVIKKDLTVYSNLNVNTLSVGDFKSEHKTINSNDNFTFKSSGSTPAKVYKIIIQGVSGTVDSFGDIREFEFLGLNDGTNNYANGDRRSIVSVSTTPTLDIRGGPLYTLVDGQTTTGGVPGSTPYAYAQGIDNTKNFTFTFTDSNKPNASLLTGFRIYYDRTDFSYDTNWGTWNLIIEDQNGNQHTMINDMVFTEANAITTTDEVYLEFTSGISYPQDITFLNTIYDINKSDGIINVTNGLNVTSGNVGIGNTTPDFPLHIQASSGKGIRVDCDNTDVELLRFTPSDSLPLSYGGALKYHGTGSGNNNKFTITMDNTTGANVDAITILQDGKTTFASDTRFNGNVGIGKNPTEKLDITGGIKFSTTINDITTTELNYLDGTTKNIETNFTVTSNHIGLFDDNTSNYFRLNEEEIVRSSNLIRQLDDNTSNYFRLNEEEIVRSSNLISLLDDNTSNYFRLNEAEIVRSSNLISQLDDNTSNYLKLLDNNTSNYFHLNEAEIIRSSNLISQLDDNTSNYFRESEAEIVRSSNLISILDDNTSNYFRFNEIDIKNTSNHIGNLDISTSNYFKNNQYWVSSLITTVLTLNDDSSNYIKESEAEIVRSSNLISLLDDNTSNYFRESETEIVRSSNLISQLDDNTSNYFRESEEEIIRSSNLISLLDDNTSNYFKLNEETISTLESGASNYVRDVNINISNYVLDIESKTSNIEIVESGNIKLNSDLTITGELTVTDLNVTGSTTQINTTTYKTENLQINNNQGDGPSLKIDHKNDDDDIIQIYNDTTKLFTIDHVGNVGIFTTDPSVELDITGGIKFTTTINNITTTELNYLDGTTQNIETNFTITSNHISQLDDNTSNYFRESEVEIIRTSNLISLLDDNTSNYFRSNETGIINTSNYISDVLTSVINNDSYASNYFSLNEAEIVRSSNLISLLDDNTSNYFRQNEEEIIRSSNLISQLDDNTSNYIHKIENKTKSLELIESDTNLKLNCDLIISGSLEVTGNTINFTSASYQTEDLEIVTNANSDSHSLSITHGPNNFNIINTTNNSGDVFVIDKDINVGIKVENPTVELDILGSIKFTTNINDISSTELNYLNGTTRNIETNFTVTSNHISILDDNTSNYFRESEAEIIRSSNLISQLDDNTSNYFRESEVEIVRSSNLISQLDDNTSNYFRESEAEIVRSSNLISLLDDNTSNYFRENETEIMRTSNYLKLSETKVNNLLTTVSTLEDNSSNYITDVNINTSNYFNDNEVNNYNTSNHILVIDTKFITDISALDTRITGNDTDIINTSNHILAIDTKFITDITTLDTRVSTDITNTSNHILLIDTKFITDISTLDTRVSTNETDITNTSNHIFAIDTKFITDISVLDTRITANDSDISSLDTRITGNDTDITALDTRVSTNETDITNTSNHILAIDTKFITDISALDTKITANDTDIINTSNHIFAIDTKFITDISALDVRITGNDTDISTLDTRITGNDTDISALDTRVSTNETNITNTSNHILAVDTKFITDISALDVRITGNDTDISTLDTRITGNDTDISALDTRVSTNETDIVNTSNYLHKIESKTSNIEIVESGNIKLNSDLTITGELTVTDLNVTGSSTQINTTTYETENLQINNSQGDGPSLKIDHKNDDDDIVQIFNDTTRLFTIDPVGNVGIFNSDPQYTLDVTGNINFTGNLTQSGSAFTSYTNTDVINLLESNHIKFNTNDIEIDEDFYIKNDNTLSIGSFKSEHKTINGDNNFTFKSSASGAAQVYKIIIQGVSGTTDQNADVREFEFLGLNDGINNYANGDRRSIMSITTTLPVAQYPSSPVVSTANWVDGNNLNYAQNSLNSYYISGNNTLNNTKNFTFTFNGSTKPNASLLTGFRIYYDRSDFSSDANWGTWNLIIEDQTGNQHTMISNMVFTEANAIDTTTQHYLAFTSGISYPQDITFLNTIYDINKSDGIINVINGLNVTSGNVGIGTTNPQYQLDVDGDINISSGSSFKINGVTIATTDTTYTGGTGITITGTTINSDVTQYSDIDVLNVLNTKGGTGITWNTGTNQFDSDITQYQNSDVASLLNSGISGGLIVNSGDVKVTDRIGIGTSTPDSSSKLHIYDTSDLFKVSNTAITTYKDILPGTDDAVDLGSAEKKFRDIYVGENSLWVGDKHKIVISDGKMKFRKRKTDYIPDIIISSGGSGAEAMSYSGVQNASDMQLHHWLTYLRTLPSAPHKANITDIFRDTKDDYDEEIATDVWLHQTANNNIYLGTNYTNIGIGNTNPQYTLDVTGNINFTGNLTQGGSAFTSYTDSDVLNLLSTKGGDGISWNSATTKFDSDITQYTNSDVTTLLNSGITGGLNVTGDVIVDGGVGVNSAGVLQVRQKGNNNVDGIALTSSYGTSHRIWKDGNGTLSIGPTTSSDSYQFRQDVNGNVGIGASINTNYKLNIGGNINFTGNLTKDGNPFTLYTDSDVTSLLTSGVNDITFTNSINNISATEFNYLDGTTQNINTNFTNTSNHIDLIDSKFTNIDILEENTSNYINNIESKTSNIEILSDGNIKLNSDLEVSGLVTLNNLSLNNELIVRGHIIADRITILDVEDENNLSSTSYSNSGDIKSFIGTYSYGANYKENLDCSIYTVSSIVSQTKIYLNNFNSSNNNTIHKGDIILLLHIYSGVTIYKKAFEVNYTNNYITLYNDAETDVDTNITVSYTTVRKYNYSLLFNDNGTYDNSSLHVVNNNSTVFTVPSNRIYNININADFDLTYGTDFCRLYVKIKNNYVEQYIRRFTLQPVTMINNNYTATLNASFKIKLQKDDIITFETNYKLNQGYLDISGF